MKGVENASNFNGVNEKATRGVILGRFMPPHAGHRYLIDFGRFSSDRLSVLLCSLPGEPISGDLREEWLRELFPSVDLAHIKEAIPEASRGSPNAVRIWAETIANVVESEIDHVYASEEYGFELAAELGATFIPVDPARETFPVSATAVREDPYGYWSYLPAPVRAYYARRVCVVQQEGEGLAARLAREFDTVAAPDYAAFIRHLYGRGVKTAERDFVGNGQHASEEALARRANRVMFSIADPGSVELRAGSRAGAAGQTGSGSAEAAAANPDAAAGNPGDSRGSSAAGSAEAAGGNSGSGGAPGSSAAAHRVGHRPSYHLLMVSAACAPEIDPRRLEELFGAPVLILSEQHARELGDARSAVQELLGG